MDIACPTCATTYEIDDASISETGRKVRCAECGTIWRTFRGGRSEIISSPSKAQAEPAPAPTIPNPPPIAPAFEDVAATPELPAAAGDIDLSATEAGSSQIAPNALPSKPRAEIVSNRKTKRKAPLPAIRGLLAPAPLMLASCAVFLSCAFVWRKDVVGILPQSAAVFAAIGAPVNLRGIEIRNIKSRMVEDNGVNVLVIDGDLVNQRAEQTTVPRLRFAVLGDKGQELFAWSAQADRGALKPGETLNFRRRLAAPPSDGKDVSVRFLTVSDITAGMK